jgi:hypothetical protein
MENYLPHHLTKLVYNLLLFPYQIKKNKALIQSFILIQHYNSSKVLYFDQILQVLL